MTARLFGEQEGGLKAQKTKADVTQMQIFRVKDKYVLQRALAVNPAYLRQDGSKETTDFMVGWLLFYALMNIKQQVVYHVMTGLFFVLQHWQLGLRKPFRSLKLWFVLRCFGLKIIQDHIRHVKENIVDKMGNKYQILKVLACYSMAFFFRQLRWQSCLGLMLGETQGLRSPLSPVLDLWSSI